MAKIRISSKICFKPALPSILNSLQLSQIHTGNHPDSSVYYPDTQIHTATSSSSSPHSDMKDHNRNKVGSHKNWLTYNHTRNIQHTPQSMRERNHTVSSYYNQTAIDDKARQNSIRLTPATIMYTGKSPDGHHIMRSAQYLHRELPVRISHRIHGFRNLPFIVGCNPTILGVHELYIRSFHILNDFPEIKTKEDEERYSQVLKGLLEDHKDVVSLLAKGFKECKKHIEDEHLVSRYLDRTLTSRLGIRMMTTHHLKLRECFGEDHVGIINISMKLKPVIEHWASFVQQLAEDKYGHAPEIRISGHVNSKFPYIEMPLDYIIPELLKNAVRATVEGHKGTRGKNLPPIYVTLANNEIDFVIKISDRGGGIPHERVNQVMQYNFSTAEESTETLMQQPSIFGNMMEESNRTTSGPMHGYGFGLPTSRAYSDYLGGSLNLYSMQGLGTDVYLRLRHFDSQHGTPFRI